MKSMWRAIALLMILIASIVLGLQWHGQASASDERYMYSPFSIGVYTSDPSVPVVIEIDVYRSPDGPLAQLFLQPPTSGSILLTSTSPDPTLRIVPGFQPMPEQSVDAIGNRVSYGYFALFNANDLTPLDGQAPAVDVDRRGIEIATFPLTDSSYLKSAGTLKARMPVIAENETGVQSYPAAALTDAPDIASWGSWVTMSIKNKPATAQGSRAPVDYSVRPGFNATVTRLFWEPKNISAREVLEAVGRQIQGWDIIDSPSDGKLDSDNFSWNGSYSLGGTLDATDRILEEERHNYEFLSGVALATGAAAAIAFVQEGDERWINLPVIRRFARRRSDADTSDKDSSATPMEPPPAGRDKAIAVTAPLPESKQTLESGIAIGLGIAAVLALLRRLWRR